MRSNFRRLFWVEIGLAAIAGLLALITPIFPDWIEFVSGWDPDQHNGSVEWMIVVGLFVVTVVMVALAAIEWRRTTATRSTYPETQFPSSPRRSTFSAFTFRRRRWTNCPSIVACGEPGEGAAFR